MKFEPNGTVNGGAFDSFTVVEVTAQDIGAPSKRMTAFLAKFGALPGVVEMDAAALAKQVVARYAAEADPPGTHAAT